MIRLRAAIRAVTRGVVLCGALLGAGAGAVAGAERDLAQVAGFGTDYGALFRRHSGRVLQAEPGRRVLELPGPVIVEEVHLADGSRRYAARDESGRAAAACLFDRLIEAGVIVRACPHVLTVREARILYEMTRAMARFVGANVEPQVPVREVGRRLQAVLESRGAAARDMACPAAGQADQGVGAALRAIVGPGGIRAVRLSLSPPRLAVMAPCA